MTPREANALLTRAALLDPRMKRVDPVEQKDMATAWASVLTRGGVTLEAALAAVEEHYLGSREAITVADIVAAAAATTLPGVEDITAELEAEWASEPKAIEGPDRMRPDRGWPEQIEDGDDE